MPGGTPVSIVNASGDLGASNRLPVESKLLGGDGTNALAATNPLPVRAPAGVIGTCSFTPAAAAYGAGDIISVAQQISWVFADTGLAVPTGSLIRILSSMLKIDQTAVISGETSYTLHNYSVTPPSAQADNATWTLASADLPSYRGFISLGTPADLGAACFIKTGGFVEDIELADGVSTSFAELVTVGAFTATAVARQVTLYGILL